MLKHAKRTLLLVAVCICAYAQGAHAILMNSWALDPQYRANADERVGWITMRNSDGSFASAASVVNFNSEWGITAAHVIDYYTGFGASSLEVGFGPDLYNDPGITRVIDSWVVNPDWNGTFSTYDVALIHYGEPLYDIPVSMLATSAPSIGTVLTCTGYGTPGVYGVNGGYDGVRRGFDTAVSKFGDSLKGVSSDYTASIWTRPGHGGNLPLSGRGNPGDSGGGVFGYDDGLLYGIMAAVSTYSPTDYSYTYSFGVWHEDVRDWISVNTPVSHQTPVPEPATLLLVGSGFAILFRHRKRA